MSPDKDDRPSAGSEQTPADGFTGKTALAGRDIDPTKEEGSAPRGELGFNERRFRKLLFGLVFLIGAVLLPTPYDLSVEGQRTIALFIFIVYLWISEALPLPVTALLAGVGIVLLGIRTEPNDAFEPYAQDTFFFILGSLILADGIAKSGADEVVANRVLKIFGRNTHTLLFGIVAITTLLASFASSHAVAAIMLPIVLGVLRHTGLRHDRKVAAAFLLAIALGANIAGLATPSAGSRNAIVIGYLRDLYDIRVSYLEWMMFAAPITLVLIPVTYVVLASVYRVPLKRIDLQPVADIPTKLNTRQKLAFLILGFTVVMWMAFSSLGLGTVAILGASLLFVAGILDWEDTRSTIPWGVAFVYGAALALGRMLNETGGANWLAVHAFDFLPHGSELILIISIVGITVLMTNFMSDGATAAALTPITLSLATLTSFNVEAMGFLTAIASAFSYLLVIGTPSNIIVYASGRVTARDFVATGIPMLIVSVLLTLAAVFWYWPLLL